MKSQFAIGKKLYQPILILVQLWLILSAIPLFSLVRYLILWKIYLYFNNAKYLTL